jgi:hypothetical protein
MAPGSNNRDMKRKPVPLLAYVLAIGPGTLLFPTVAGAIPGNQSPAIVATELTPDFHADSPIIISEQHTSSEGNPGRQDKLPSGSHTCRQDLPSGVPADDGTRGKPCVDASDAQQRVTVQLGRRIGTRGDILGEFDGVRVDYRLSGTLKLNGIAGYPVLAAEETFDSDRKVFGISAATNPFARAWDLNGYLIEQQENGQTDRKSMGGAVRYLQPGRSLLVCLDHDVADNSMDTLMASGAWKLPFKTTISTTLDRRNRPIPGRQQKFLQQSMTVMDGWNWILPADRLAYYTGNGSSEVSSLAVGLSHALSRRIKLSGDVAVLDATNDADTDAVTAQSSEYSYHFKLAGKDLMLPGDRNKLDLRHNVTETGRTSTAVFDTKYAINRFWNIMPKLRADYRRPVLENTRRWVASPTVKMEYRRNKQSGFQIEAGGEWSTIVKSTADDDRSSSFVSMGYQAKF